MTMIAFATYGDHAEFITDSASYLHNGSALASATKSHVFQHLDLAVLTQGDSAFGDDAVHIVNRLSAHLVTVDEVIEQAPRHFASAWQNRLEEFPGAGDAMVFLIGYSTQRDRFVAWSFASDRSDFKPEVVGAPYVMPCPWVMRPDLLQARRYRHWDRETAAFHGREPVGHLVLEKWMSRQAMTAPGSVDEWAALARLVREDRAESDYASVYVAGDVFHTRLARGESATRRIHSYDDQGEGFLKMIAGTQHPIAQLMPCPCGSGLIYLECCLAPALDETCGCNSSGKTFRECCAVDPQLAVDGRA